MKHYIINIGIGLNMFFAEYKVFYPPVADKQKYTNVYSKKAKRGY